MLVLEVGDLFRHFISGTGTGTLITMIPLITFIINPKGGRWWWWGEGRGGRESSTTDCTPDIPGRAES